MSWQAGLLAAVLVVALGFLFVTVSSRLTGEIGSSSNPISGMTVATPHEEATEKRFDDHVAYDRALRKGCAIAMLKRLASLREMESVGAML